jgi:HD-GYP domain-containing protein (c-di-GMP phosphodiesterase class II)
LISTEQLTPGMTLGEAVVGARGRTLLGRGVAVTARYVELLRELGIPAVYVHDPDTADVRPPCPVPQETRVRVLGNLTRAFEQVSRAGEQMRRVPLEVLRDHLADDKFANAVAGAGAADALCDLADDVDGLVDALRGQDVLTGLNSIKAHDQYTFLHSIDVTIMGLVLGQRAGWDRAKLRAFGVGCLLHDIGKILVEPELLNKAGPLTPEEFERLKAHPTLGYEVIRAVAPRLGALAPQAAYQHHERQDGTGYPRGLRGNEHLGANEPGRIHDFGAMCAVADVYDAMASHRPYRRARPMDEVVRTIKGYANTHLNGEAVRTFLSVVAPYPVCTDVRVTTGRHAGCRGVVTKVRKADLARPTVRLLYDAAGERMDPIEVDLSVDRDVRVCSVPPDDRQLPHSLGSAAAQPPPPPRPKFDIPKAVLAALKAG